MSTAALPTVQPVRRPRSLPTLTVFRHPAARLVKTVPQLQPSPRINAHVPIDTLGVGRIAPSQVVLQDVYGPLSILVVPDPLDPTIATLVLSVGFDDHQLHGAARRFVLPFRSFQRDPVSGQLVSQSKIKGFDAADRVLYPGLGAGPKGLDGGSFWFFEDVGEQGALDRYRWETAGVGRRAIWTVWLISTPAPVVLHVQNLLQSYPAPVPPLPPWLKENNGFPWRDSYITVPDAVPVIESQHDPKLSAVVANDTQPSSLPRAAASHWSPPPIPQLQATPENLEGSRPESPQACSVAVEQQPATSVTSSLTDDTSPQDSKEFSVENAAHDVAHHDEPSQAGQTASCLTVRSRHLRDGSSAVTIGDSPAVVLRDVRRSAVNSRPEYRNSLVAVDNVTGQIIGVLASDISLDPSQSGTSDVQPMLSSSSDDTDTDIDEEDEMQACLDEHTHVLQEQAAEHALGLHTLDKELPIEPVSVISDEDKLCTPRQSIFKPRPTSIYRDAGTERLPSRPPSILASDTFAPPPLPPKQSSPRGARRNIPEPAPSIRDSTASAAFFSAESDAEAMSSYDSDALEIDAGSITHLNLPTSLISIRGKVATDLERHRPELLQDVKSEEGMESDTSGSTVGGPAVRMWRKVRGKAKKKASARKRCVAARQASEVSDRTSKAETALEVHSDAEAEQVEDVENETQGAAAAQTTTEEDVVAPLPERKGPGHHLPRSALRTDEVRSIEDRIWREALENDQLPIDAPYTHLAARGEAGLYPSSILSSPRFVADGSAIELLSAEEKARAAERSRKKQQMQSQRAERMINMQGGSVLIEFLAGSSRIGASLIRKAGMVDVGGGSCEEQANKAEEAGVMTSVFGYVPLLPQHLLSLLGLASSPCTSVSAAAGAASSTSYLRASVSGLLSDASGWVSSLFTSSSSSAAECETQSAAETQELDASKAEAWEYAIPTYDPDSLASTPRPIYRRKRPSPSPTNGFAISSPQAQTQPYRYSIIHIDNNGVGRRTFLRPSTMNE